MSIDPKSLAPILADAAKIADLASSLLPGTGSVIAQFVKAALQFGSELASQGADPITHIERLHAAEPLLQDAENSWADALRNKFGGTSTP